MKTWWNILTWMWIGVTHGEEHVNGDFVLTSSPPTGTDGELFTLTCGIRNKSAVNIGWLQNNISEVTTQKGCNCSKQPFTYGYDFISRINVSCSTTAHSIAFRFNSTTDQGAAWQCGNLATDTLIDPRSNIYTIDVASSVMSTQSLPTTTRYIDTTSDPETVTASKASTHDNGSDTLYIVLGAVGGAVLLTVVIVGIVCIRRRRNAAYQQNEVKQERNGKATLPVYQNTASSDIMENELYEMSRDVSPINEAENQEDGFMLSDAYAGVDMPATNTCTPREQVASGVVNMDDLYAKPDKTKVTQVQKVSDIYAEVRKPKKKK